MTVWYVEVRLRTIEADTNGIIDTRETHVRSKRCDSKAEALAAFAIAAAALKDES